VSARRATIGLVAGALLSAAAASGVGTAGAGAVNYSSHDAAFFTNLLAGRVWLYERPNAARAGDRGLAWGVHHAADGVARACFRLGGVWQARTGRWRVVPSPRFRALYNYYKAGSDPDPGHAMGHVPVFYDPGTGRLHSESLDPAASPAGRAGRWFVLSLGWVQESWPQALKEACPELELPPGLAVNRLQTSAVMEEAVAQDLDAALRAFPGSELRAPGSVGLGMAAGAPTVTAAELARFLAANDGRVLVSPEGVRLALALGPERDELWRLDADGGVIDTAVLLPVADGEPGRFPAGISVQWERLPRRQDYRVGDPFPLSPTGERHGAFLLTDRLIAGGRPVVLPFGEGSAAALRFHEGGRVSAESAEGGEVRGRWRWSRGLLHVALDGGETVAWPWRAVAALVPGPDAPAGQSAGE